MVVSPVALSAAVRRASVCRSRGTGPVCLDGFPCSTTGCRAFCPGDNLTTGRHLTFVHLTAEALAFPKIVAANAPAVTAHVQTAYAMSAPL